MKVYADDWSAKNKDELKKSVVTKKLPQLGSKTSLDVFIQMYEGPLNKALKL